MHNFFLKTCINKIEFNTGTNILDIFNNQKSQTLFINVFQLNVLKQNAEKFQPTTSKQKATNYQNSKNSTVNSKLYYPWWQPKLWSKATGQKIWDNSFAI